MFSWSVWQDILAMEDTNFVALFTRTVPLMLALEGENFPEGMFRDLLPIWNRKGRFEQVDMFKDDEKKTLAQLIEMCLMWDQYCNDLSVLIVETGSLWMIRHLARNEVKEVYVAARNRGKYVMMEHAIKEMNRQTIDWMGQYGFIYNDTISVTDRMKTLLVLIRYHYEYYPSHSNAILELIAKDIHVVDLYAEWAWNGRYGDGCGNSADDSVTTIGRHLIDNNMDALKRFLACPATISNVSSDGKNVHHPGNFILCCKLAAIALGEMKIAIDYYKAICVLYGYPQIPHPLNILYTEPGFQEVKMRLALMTIEFHHKEKHKELHPTHHEALVNYFGRNNLSDPMMVWPTGGNFTAKEKNKLTRYARLCQRNGLV